jgi:hypothetical protein
MRFPHIPHKQKALGLLVVQRVGNVVKSALVLPGFIPGTFSLGLSDLHQVYWKPQLVSFSVCSGRDSSWVPPEYKSEPLTFQPAWLSVRYCVKWFIVRYNKLWPITVAARSKAWIVFARSNTGVVRLNPTQSMAVCIVCIYSVFMFFCV